MKTMTKGMMNVSIQRDVSKGYICPECDLKMSGKKIKRGNGR